MQIKWERNSRALALAAQGKIKGEDIIPRTTTDNFPAEAATVRMHKLAEKIPFITVHIKGESKQRGNRYNNYTWEYSTVCRINLGGSYDTAMCSNGDLDEKYSWLDVHNVVTDVKGAMGI